MKPFWLFSTTLCLYLLFAKRNAQSSFALATSMPYPHVIYLVNAGCQRAGPKILSDLCERVSDRCKDLRHWLKVKGETASSRSALKPPSRQNIIQGRKSDSAFRRMLNNKAPLVSKSPYGGTRYRFSALHIFIQLIQHD